MNANMGQLYVFEGADGVGKSTLAKKAHDAFTDADVNCNYISFPGKRDGTLGKHIYDIHHDPNKFGIANIPSDSLQLLHVAAHIDEINSVIVPALKLGVSIILDRFWWSTIAYGLADGVSREFLNSICMIENDAWLDIKPEIIFLIKRTAPLRKEPIDKWRVLCGHYDDLIKDNQESQHIVVINNESTVGDAIADIMCHINFNEL